MSSNKGSNKANGKEKAKKATTNKSKNKNAKNNKNIKNNKNTSKHPKLKKALKILGLIILIAIIVIAGIIGGVVFGLFGDDLKITAADLSIDTMNSVLVDINGNEIAKLNGEENREVVKLSEMGDNIPKAFIAIEDKRFYDHNGVDLKRTFGATIKYVIDKDNSYGGGSTLTQQLIKNATGEKKKDWTRKVKEIVRAYQIEREMSKDQILEAYLNTIPLGGGSKNVHGVKVAARFYFDKEPAELTIEEAAFMAGINHSPNIYNPFKENPNTERIVKRTKTVLKEMKEQGKIDETQYNEATQKVDAGLPFKEGTITYNNSLTQNEELAVKQVISDYAEEKDLSKDIAEKKIKGGGYKIYITENRDYQKILDDTYTTSSDWIQTKTVTRTAEDGTKTKEKVQLQSAMVVIDHKTGYVIASVGVLGEKTPWGTNRVVATGHQPGSSIKPLAVIAPSLEEKKITAGSVADDTPVSYGSYKPHNDTGGYYGLMNIRYILRVSRNIPEVKLMKNLTPAKSLKYLESFGISSLDKKDEGLSLALGGISNGVSPLEMAGAYATIANNGEYIEPIFYTKVEDSSGNLIIEKKQERHRVLSEQNAYIMQSLLREPTGTGLTGASGATATGAKIKGQVTCGKTGTANETRTTWFCGFTPYYTGVMYFGYDVQEDGKSVGSGTVARRWGGIMTKIHAGLEEKDFEKPSGIVSGTVCKDSGLLANELCSQDPRGGRGYSEMFVSGTVPSKTCNVHVKLKVCKDTGKIANEFCTNVEEKVFITRTEGSGDAWKSASDAQYMAPTETCDVHTKPVDKVKPVITLKGTPTVTIAIKQAYVDAGATAKDDIDGDITSKIQVKIQKDGKVVDKIDTSKVGTYIITYTVADAAGNIDAKTRTVKIVESTSTTNPPNGNNTGGTTGAGNTGTAKPGTGTTNPANPSTTRTGNKQ